MQRQRHYTLPGFCVRAGTDSTHMEASGTDEVGAYSCQIFWCHGRLSLYKKYVRGSRNVRDIHSAANAGHRVIYIGCSAGAAAGHGFKGR